MHDSPSEHPQSVRPNDTVVGELVSYVQRSTGTVVITVNITSQRGLTITSVGAETVDRREAERLKIEESSILIRVPRKFF